MTKEVYIAEVYDVTFTVEAYYYAGGPSGDYDVPDDPEEIEMWSVKVENSNSELIDLLQEDVIEKIHDTIIQENYR